MMRGRKVQGWPTRLSLTLAMQEAKRAENELATAIAIETAPVI
jgi:hypothetical protein